MSRRLVDRGRRRIARRAGVPRAPRSCSTGQRLYSTEEAAARAAAVGLRKAFVKPSIEVVDVVLMYLAPTPNDYSPGIDDRLRPAFAVFVKGIERPNYIDAFDGTVLSSFG